MKCSVADFVAQASSLVDELLGPGNNPLRSKKVSMISSRTKSLPHMPVASGRPKPAAKSVAKPKVEVVVKLSASDKRWLLAKHMLQDAKPSLGYNADEPTFEMKMNPPSGERSDYTFIISAQLPKGAVPSGKSQYMVHGTGKNVGNALNDMIRQIREKTGKAGKRGK